MKCPKCHRQMVRKNGGNNIYYYECRHCGNTIGKPAETKATDTVKN